MPFFKTMTLKTQLIVGFSMMAGIIALIVFINIIQVREALELSHRVTELRTPTVNHSTMMLDGLNHALAALRGWMLLGQESFKEERAKVWSKKLEAPLRQLKKLSVNWTNPENVERLNEINVLLLQLKQFQQKIEEIAHTPDNIPSLSMFFEQAVPQSNQMSNKITQMIDLEKQAEASPARKALLGIMADVRGTLGLSLANIRAFLLSGKPQFQARFEALWTKNETRFNELKDQTDLLTPKQLKAFELFFQTRHTFSYIVSQMLEKRSQPDWNRGNYWLATNAAPLATQLVNLLEEMTTNQQQLLQHDGEKIDKLIKQLIKIEWFLLGIGILLAGVLGWFMAIGILRQIGGEPAKVAQITEQVAAGNLNLRLESAQTVTTGIYASVNQIIQQLQQVTEESVKSDWLKTGQTDLNEKMRGEQELIVLTNNVLSYLADYIKAQVGVFFLAQEDRLKLVSSYAYKQRNNNYNEFKLGESLVGQAALEKKSILFRQIPEEHLHLSINSGMDESPPHDIFVLPLIYENQVLGVLELGTSRHLTATEMELLDRVADNIAISLSSAQSRLRMQALLEESQQFTLTLQTQQQEVVEREERIRAIVDTVIDAIITIDEGGIIESFNKAAERIFGYRSMEVIGQNVKILMPEPYHGEHDQYLHNYLSTGHAQIIGNPREVLGQRKDGSTFPIDLAIDEMFVGDKRLFTGIIRDITDRKKAEEALQLKQNELIAREERIRTIVDTVVDAIITINERGMIESFNKAAEKIFGYQAAEVMGQNIKVLMPEPYHGEHDQYLHNYSTTGIAKIIGQPREVRGQRKEGSTFPIDLAIDEMVVGDKRLFTGIVRDITERKNAEKCLRQQQEELRSANEELQAQQEELSANNEELQSQQEELRVANAELGERTGALEENKQALEYKARALEISTQYKSEFLANMSHELRTPLNSLLILAQLLGNNKTGNLTDKEVEYAQTIHSAGADLLTLINEILDLSKVEAGKIEIYPENVSLTEWLKTIEQKFCHVATEQGLAFNITVVDDLPLVLYTDIQRLKQIINNLLSNAIKFTRQGEVNLDIRKASVHELRRSGLQWDDASESPNFIAISVIDTGIGIPKDKQQVIFEAFQQVDGSTSRRYGGTGLGLSISRQLAQLLGGEIQLSSEEGKGSTFTLYLPETMSVPDETSAPQPTPDDVATPQPTSVEPLGSDPVAEEEIADDRHDLTSTNKCLLIIEDDSKFSRTLMELAREKNFKCILATDGKTGLQIAEQYQPHAIILDVGLPTIDGWTVMEKLKDNPNLRHIPVHFISAYDQQMDAKKRGAIGYLHKPVNMEQIEEAFKKIERFISNPVKNLLVVVDNEPHQQQILDLVGDENVKFTLAVTVAEALQHLQVISFDCIILDIDVEQGSGTQLCEQLHLDANLSQIPIILHADRDLSQPEEKVLQRCANHLTVKTVRSPERLLDEATLFLHQVEANLPLEKRKMLQMVHDKTAILESKKVLIVDDDARNTYALATVLEDNDMEVIVGINGLEALALLEEHADIALVLMDIMMPEMDGYEAMQKIRQQPRYRQLPIIALTAKAMKGDKAKCIEAGANDYLSKPVDSDKLISLMRVWLYR